MNNLHKNPQESMPPHAFQISRWHMLLFVLISLALITIQPYYLAYWQPALLSAQADSTKVEQKGGSQHE